ncbi:MAG: tRNA epoxyqueuosine(34) reductase QueG [Myxococcota bacterium]
MVEKIRESAAEFKIDEIGFCGAEALKEEGARFKKWLSDGMHAGMHWLAKDPSLRSDPAKLIENARTVIVALLRYGTQSPTQDPSAPLFSHYSLYADYHTVFGKRLKSLARFIRESLPHSNTYASVDTGRVLERAFAVKAGMGFRGKNTSLIHPRFGANCFIGVIITDAEISFAAPPEVENGCGGCDLCLKACPTGALVKPYSLDARKCISYHTIENRGEIPDWIKEKTGNRVFGCDECYNACPYNKWDNETGEISIPRLIEPKKQNIESLLDMDEREFRKRFSQTPVSRAGCNGLKRNAIICAGNSGRKSLASLLSVFTADESPILSRTAEWAIKKLS